MRSFNLRLKSTLACIITSLVIIPSIQAQVTIGSSISPNYGALLDLKQWEPDANNVTASKGIMLPRVHLSTRNSLWDIEGKPTNVIDYAGLIVYNTSDRENFSPGVYMWDGEKWFSLMGEEDNNIPNPGEGNDKTEFNPNTGILKDHEGNRYHTGDFGDAGIWTLQNLRTRSFPNKGGAIAHTDKNEHNNSDTDPQYGFPGHWTPEQENTSGIPEFVREYGLLYNWSAATFKKEVPTQGTPNEGGLKHEQVQGLCPNGWHLPSDGEWTQLENEIIKNTSKYSSAPDIGGVPLPYDGLASLRGKHAKSMLAKMTVHDGKQDVEINGLSNIVDQKGFWVIPVGFAFTQTAENFGLEAHFWASSIHSVQAGWVRTFSTMDTQVKNWYDPFATMISIRCKKDNSGVDY